MTSPDLDRPYAIVKTDDAAIFLAPCMRYACDADPDHGAPDTAEHFYFELSPEEWRVLAPFIAIYLEPLQARISYDRGANGEAIMRLPDEEGEAIDLFISVFLADVEDVDLRYLEARAKQWFTHYVHLGADGHDAFLADQPTF